MANKKISELPAATTPLSGAEKLEGLQGGINVQLSAQNIADLVTITEYFDGYHTSIAALQAAMPTSAAGHYAIVDEGTGYEADFYIWDLQDGWVQSSSQGGGAVSSVFGRIGVVIAVSGDYTASQITNTPAGNISSTNVQAALNEIDAFIDSTLVLKANKFITYVEKLVSHQLDSADLTMINDGEDIEHVMTSASAVNFTLPSNATLAIPIGASGAVRQNGAGQVSFVAGAGVTVNSLLNALNTAGQNAVGFWRKTNTNEFHVSGELVL